MRYFIKNKLLIFVCLLCYQLAFTQTYTSKNYTTLDGLPNKSIYAIKKDSRGFLWVGTGAGISKINNDVITNFYEEDGLAYNNCWAIEEDSNKNMWFGSYGGGLTFFDGKNFSVLNTSSGLINNHIRKLFSYKEDVFVGTKNGVSVIDINSKSITNLVYEKDDRFQVMGFFVYENEVYIQTYRSGLWKYDKNNKKLIFLHHKYNSVFSIFKLDNALFVSFDGFAYKNKSIKKFNIQDYISGIKPTSEFGNSVFWSYTADNKQNIYGVADGINYPTGGLYEVSNKPVSKQNTLLNIKSTKQWCIDYDKSNNNLYVGTLDKGVFKVNLNKEIAFFNEVKNVIDIEVKDTITYVLSEKGLYIKSKNSTSYILPKDFYSKKNYFFNHNKTLISEEDARGQFQNNSLKNIEFRSIKKINDDIWVNTTIGLFKLSEQNSIEKYLPIYTDSFYFTSKNAAFFQRPYSHVYALENLHKKVETIIFDLKNKENPRDVVSIEKVNNQLYFLSKSSGLYKYQNEKFISFLKNDIWDEKELTQAVVNNQDQLVIGTSRGDVFITETLDYFKVVKTIKNKNIIGNSILFLKIYNDYLIIGTERGINLYKDDNITFLDKEQGLNNTLFTSAVIAKNKLLVGSEIGYYDIDLDKVIANHKAKTYNFSITDIQVNYEKIASYNYHWFQYFKKTIELPYNRNTISFTYVVKNHPYPNKLKYRYKITSIENSKWSNWTVDNTIHLNYLKNGNYNVIVEVKDYSTGQTYAENILEITILPPFWKTWWFMCICIIVVLFVLYSIYKIRVRRIKKEEVLKEAIYKRVSGTKIEALQSQMNPHFIFNAMNSIQNFIIDNDIDNSLKYMGEFSKLIRKTLYNSSLQYISLAEEISYLQTYIELENLRFQTKIHTSIISNNLDTEEIAVPPMLLQPIIENVFKHAFNIKVEKPLLTIEFTQNNDSLICEITDNGSGFDANSTKSKSKGIKLVKERLHLLNLPEDSLAITSIALKGTVVTVTLKMRTLNN
ncbi:histidine kinase [Tenacibaculum sp. AHE15PA]|uniref:sensor histidine kinase n=1 Tax=unclassified Tenacibaculum TaxID=2635139 RepID=UPI001C4F5A13|nr:MULTISPECIES: histidine kinase [unclassified Tenacibaculum]QXP74354.1 histidine kinase [Tenacibaculum sp. AHE14PA]QXP75276.1 histidine kinase [Tenacibaculum sp. AHE15PA]